MTHLDLFSGIGGFALAAHWAGFQTVAFCEIDDYAQKILGKNFGAQVVADAQRNGKTRTGKAQPGKASLRRKLARGRPIFRDIRELDGAQFRGVTLVTGGFPCQPFSLAGKQLGARDDRHLWPEMLRVITEARPAWVLAENVPGIIGMEFGHYLFDVASLDAAIAFGLASGLDPWPEIIGERILGLHSIEADLQAIGYGVQSVVVPACAVDARHQRARVWIVANSEGGRRGELRGPSRSGGQSNGGGQACADAASAGSQERQGKSAREALAAVERSGFEKLDWSLEHAESCGRGKPGQASRRGAQGQRENGSGQSSEALADAAQQLRTIEGRETFELGRGGKAMADAEQPGSLSTALGGIRCGEESQGARNVERFCQWPVEPGLGRVANGVPRRVDRLKGLGNAIVPQVAFEILKMIAQIEQR